MLTPHPPSSGAGAPCWPVLTDTCGLRSVSLWASPLVSRLSGAGSCEIQMLGCGPFGPTALLLQLRGATSVPGPPPTHPAPQPQTPRWYMGLFGTHLSLLSDDGPPWPSVQCLENCCFKKIKIKTLFHKLCLFFFPGRRVNLVPSFYLDRALFLIKKKGRK